MSIGARNINPAVRAPVTEPPLVPASALAPLAAFYAESRLPMPAFHRLDGDALPEPCRSLLHHTRDMTGTLAAFHRQPINLRVLNETHTDTVLTRRVVLVRAGDEAIVEFGASRTILASLGADARAAVLAGKIPLGAVLTSMSLRFISTPTAFFTVACDSAISSALGVPAGTTLHGRCNALTTADGVEISSVVEILPLMPPPRG